MRAAAPGSALLASALLAAALVAAAPAGPAAAQATTTTVPVTVTVIPSTTMPPLGDDLPGIIPRPNSGKEPEASGDRGGAAQLALLAFLVGGLTLIALLVWRESRRARRRRPVTASAGSPAASRPPAATEQTAGAAGTSGAGGAAGPAKDA